MSEVRTTPIIDLTLDDRFAVRDRLDEETVQRYMECFDDLPPAVAYELAQGLVLVAGRHRREAAPRLHRIEIPVEVRQGTEEQALEFALLDNLRHGLPLKRAERRRVIARWFRLHPERSNQWIAQDLGVSKTTVELVRRKLEAGCQIDTLSTLVGRDGKAYPRTIEQPKREPVDDGTVPQATEAMLGIQGARLGEGDREGGETAAVVKERQPLALNQAHNLDGLEGMRRLDEESVSVAIVVATGDPLMLCKGPDYGRWNAWTQELYRVLQLGGQVFLVAEPEWAAEWKVKALDPFFAFRAWIVWQHRPLDVDRGFARCHHAVLCCEKALVGEALPPEVGGLGVLEDLWRFDDGDMLPESLAERLVLAAAEGELVLDPVGVEVVAQAAARHGRRWIGFSTKPPGLLSA